MATQQLDTVERGRANRDACVAYFKNVYNKNRVMYPTPFHQALINNDTQIYEDVIDKLHDDLKAFVLNSPLTWDQRDYPSSYFQMLSHFTEATHQNSKKLIRRGTVPELFAENTDCMNQKKWRVELPLSLIAVTGDTRFLIKAMQDGGNPLSVDSKGNNVIHDLVNLSRVNPKIAVAMFEALLSCLQNATVKRKVLKHRNRKGRKPLDVAAQKHLPEMFLALMNTDDVYKITIQDCLLHKHVMYDVSDYESPFTNEVSPMHFFKALTDEEVQRYDDCQFFTREPIKSWLEARCQTSRFCMLFWTMVWVVYYFIYWFCSYEYQFKDIVHSSLLIALTVISVLIIIQEWLFDIKRLKADTKAIWNFFRNGRIPATVTGVYRKFHNLFAYSCILFSVTQISGLNCTHPDVVRISYWASITFGCLSLLYIIQINKRVGHLLILLLKMLYDATIFLTIGVVFFFAATNLRYVMKYPVDTCRSNATVISHDQALENYFDVMFETFLLVLTIKAPSTNHSNLWIHQISKGVYIFSVILFTIILFNMLVGIMTKRITEIESHKDTLLKLEKLSVLFYSERSQRNSAWFRLGIPQRHYKVSKDFSKVYLEVVEDVIK